MGNTSLHSVHPYRECIICKNKTSLESYITCNECCVTYPNPCDTDSYDFKNHCKCSHCKKIRFARVSSSIYPTSLPVSDKIS